MVTAPAPSSLGALARAPSLREQAADALRELIVRGDLAAGDRVNEVEVSSSLGISRGPLREALQRLVAEGLIEFRPNRGAFVRSFTLDTVKQLYEVREAIESKAAMLAAQRASEAEIRQLNALLTETDTVLGANPATAYPATLDLHQLVLELSGNEYLHRCGTDLQLQVRLARLTSGRSPQRARQALAEHGVIIEAIAARDPHAAGAAMTAHLSESLVNLVRMSSDTKPET